MDSSTIGATGAILGAVDLAAIAGVFFYLNNRISVLEKANGSSPTSGLNAVSTGDVDQKAETRIARLEDEIEILLERLDAYDKLFAKLMYSMKEISMHGENQVSGDFGHQLRPYRSNIRRRTNALLEFRDDEVRDPSGSPPKGSTPPPKNAAPSQNEIPDIDSDDEMFSFLK